MQPTRTASRTFDAAEFNRVMAAHRRRARLLGYVAAGFAVASCLSFVAGAALLSSGFEVGAWGLIATVPLLAVALLATGEA